MIEARLFRRGKARDRKVGGAGLRVLTFDAQTGKNVTPAARWKIYEAIRTTFFEKRRGAERCVRPTMTYATFEDDNVPAKLNTAERVGKTWRHIRND